MTSICIRLNKIKIRRERCCRLGTGFKLVLLNFSRFFAKVSRRPRRSVANFQSGKTHHLKIFEVWQKKFSRIRRQRVASSFHFLPYPSGEKKKSVFCLNCCLFLKKRNNWSSSGWITLRKFLYSHSDFSFYASLLLLQLFVRSLQRLPGNNLRTLVGLCLFDLVVVLVKWFEGSLCKF